MKTTLPLLGAALAALAVAPAAEAMQTVTAAQGQDAARQAQDQAECSTIATQQTGFNPAMPPPAAVANAQVSGSGTRARGAATGAAIGAMSGNAGAGAAAGVVAGGVTQRSRNRKTARAQNDAMAQGQAAWDQARAGCLSSRGYTVR
jgi:hypothetical protein